MLLDVEAGSAEDSLPAEEINRFLALNFLWNNPVLTLFAFFSDNFSLHQHLMDRLRIQIVHIFYELECLLIKCGCCACEIDY